MTTKNKAKTAPAQSGQQRPELCFDGCGINGPDEYRERIATFNRDAYKYGPLFASAPDLLAERDNLKELLLATQRAAIECAEERDNLKDQLCAERTENILLNQDKLALLSALNKIVAMLTQPVQFTGLRNGASVDILRYDSAAAVKFAQSAASRLRAPQHSMDDVNESEVQP